METRMRFVEIRLDPASGEEEGGEEEGRSGGS